MISTEKITSKENQRLVAARKIRDGKDRERIFVEGARLVGEAVSSQIKIEQCFVVEGFRDQKLLEQISQSVGQVVEVSAKLFRSLADTTNPQGIAVIAQRPRWSKDDLEMAVRAANLPIVIYLKEINNPSNLGAVIRTAEAAGVTGVIISDGSADVYSPKALRASMGSCFRLSIVDMFGLPEMTVWAVQSGLRTIAADISGDVPYFDFDWLEPVLLVFGSESHGLSKDELVSIDEVIKIPMDNNVESLNLAVSSGIILFEARRQRSRSTI